MEARQWWDEARDATRDVRRVVLEEPPAKLLKQGGFKRGSASWQKNQEERAGVLQRARQRAEEAEQALAAARRENRALRKEAEEQQKLNDAWREERYGWRQELRVFMVSVSDSPISKLNSAAGRKREKRQRMDRIKALRQAKQMKMDYINRENQLMIKRISQARSSFDHKEEKKFD